jgi:hypothetical protein
MDIQSKKAKIFWHEVGHFIAQELTKYIKEVWGI